MKVSSKIMKLIRYLIRYNSMKYESEQLEEQIKKAHKIISKNDYEMQVEFDLYDRCLLFY